MRDPVSVVVRVMWDVALANAAVLVEVGAVASSHTKKVGGENRTCE